MIWNHCLITLSVHSAELPVIVIAGDFNSFDTSFLEVDFELDQIVDRPTHCNHILDKFFTNRPDIYHADVFASIIKTKHQAVYVTQTLCSKQTVKSGCKKFLLYDLRKHHINALRYYLGVYDWSHILLNEDIQTVYDQFLNILRFYVRLCIPVRTVRAGRRDPDYISPYVKLLLAKRNRLRKRGHSAAADKLAYAINQIIATNMRNRLRKVTNAPIKEMWQALKLNNPERDSSSRIRHLLADTNRVNQYFANVSFDQAYNETVVEAERPSVFGATTAFKPLYAYEVETMLRKVSKTSPGCDNVPFWVFKLYAHLSLLLLSRTFITVHCAPAFCRGNGCLLIITPVPKVPTPSTLSDFRPISVTPILSRVIEKCVVTRWLRPAIPSELLADQFAFRSYR
jgi:hypothetical protein